MTCIRTVALVLTALFSAACGVNMPVGPTGIATSESSAVAAAPSATASTLQVSCTVDIGSTTRPLPALHVLAAWINASQSASSLTCGQVRSLAAKLQQEVAALDQPTQNFDAACGASSALLRELEALTSTGRLAQLTFPAPVEGAPTSILGVAEETNDHFCVAAHE